MVHTSIWSIRIWYKIFRYVHAGLNKNRIKNGPCMGLFSGAEEQAKGNGDKSWHLHGKVLSYVNLMAVVHAVSDGCDRTTLTNTFTYKLSLAPWSVYDGLRHLVGWPRWQRTNHDKQLFDKMRYGFIRLYYLSTHVIERYRNTSPNMVKPAADHSQSMSQFRKSRKELDSPQLRDNATAVFVNCAKNIFIQNRYRPSKMHRNDVHTRTTYS